MFIKIKNLAIFILFLIKGEILLIGNENTFC